MLPLKNKRVVITRPKDKIAPFSEKLKKLGAEPVELPLIQLSSINQPELLATYQQQQFDWIVFTSYNAVHTFFEVVEVASVHSKIAVVGPKTMEALEEYNLTASFVPLVYTAAALVKEMPLLENQTVLLPQSAIAKKDIELFLKERKAKVYSVKSYENKKISYTPSELKSLFKNGVDYITFTSGSTVKSFIDLGIGVNNAKVVCIGPETAETAKQLDVKVDAVANPFTEEGIIEAIINLEMGR
ncbi:MAG: uroporphyrinogen-III synthase [Vicingus serpentipes]|nr:uroporphyrinogen-III synthase [Vicingus serpentipes]